MPQLPVEVACGRASELLPSLQRWWFGMRSCTPRPCNIFGRGRPTVPPKLWAVGPHSFCMQRWLSFRLFFALKVHSFVIASWDWLIVKVSQPRLVKCIEWDFKNGIRGSLIILSLVHRENCYGCCSDDNPRRDDGDDGQCEIWPLLSDSRWLR